MKNKIKVYCYETEYEFDSKEEVLDEYIDNMSSSYGSEKERYCNIIIQAKNNAKQCYDLLEDRTGEIVKDANLSTRAKIEKQIDIECAFLKGKFTFKDLQAMKSVEDYDKLMESLKTSKNKAKTNKKEKENHFMNEVNKDNNERPLS